MEVPEILIGASGHGYVLDRETLTPVRERLNVTTPGDYGADPLGDGTFRMVPSGDIVDFEERCRRLARFHPVRRR